MALNTGLERIGRIAGCGSVIRITTVSGSGVVTSSRPSSRNAALPLRYRTRSIDHLTSADVRGLPLTNFTFGRSLKVYVLPSGETVQLVASEGFGVFRSSPSNVTSES